MAALNHILSLNLGLAEIFHLYTLSKNKGAFDWYLKVRKSRAKLVESTLHKELNDDDFLWVSAIYEDSEKPIPCWYINLMGR